MNRPRTPFGLALRKWRETRGLSQLKLATLAGTSPRYLSFVETGRSRPNRGVVLRLAQALEVPLREQNQLLAAAGLSPAFTERTLPELHPFLSSVRAMIAAHDPFPAFVFDRAYRLVDANAAARRIVPGLEERGWIDAMFAPDSPLRAATENFAEIGWTALETLRREHGSAEVVRRLEEHLSGVARPALELPSDGSPILSARFRFGDACVSTFSTILRFGNSRDVTLDELRVELVFPSDDVSARFFRGG